MKENKYKIIFDNYVSGQYSSEEFIDQFSEEWRQDRDDNSSILYDEKFQRLIGRVFTSCDCFHQTIEQIRFSEKQLKDEVQLLSYIWFG